MSEAEDTGWISVTEEDWLLRVSLHRPEKLNAMTLAMVERMVDAALQFQAENHLRVMLFTAEGRYFSSGMDVGHHRPDFAGSTAEARRYYRSIPVQRLAEILETVEKPVVAAHQGICLGGALEFSLSCDFRLASHAAAYGLPEIRLGVLPGSGGTSRLTRIAGPHWARWLAMAGENVDAHQALAIGLVHNVFPDSDFEREVRAFCERLNALPPEAMAMAKLAIELTADLERQQARSIERLANSILMVGPERAERLATFMNRARRVKSE